MSGSAKENPQRSTQQPAAALPKRTAGRFSCPGPDPLVASPADPDLLRAVLKGLYRLNSGATR